MYKTLGNIALNDICLFNTQSFEWETLAMYGQTPISRWNHSLIAVNESKLIIFGGLNMNTYMNSSNLWVFEIGEYPVEKLIEKAKQKIADINLKIRAL